MKHSKHASHKAKKPSSHTKEDTRVPKHVGSWTQPWTRPVDVVRGGRSAKKQKRGKSA